MPPAAISVTALEKWFPPAQAGWRAFLQPFAAPTSPALRGISFGVAEGEAVALLGANGAGKTTLLRILATLLLPTRGTASLSGHDAAKEPWAVRKRIGYHAGSDLGFYPRLTGRQNLRFFGQLNRLSGSGIAAGIDALAERFEIVDALDRQVRLLSTGTVQRLSLMRSLLHQPRTLLLDEPTRSMDALAAAHFRRFLKSEIISTRGVSVLFASHSMQEIELLADRVVILRQGRLVAVDSPSAIKAKYHSRSLEEAFGQATEEASSIESSPGRVPSAEGEPLRR